MLNPRVAAIKACLLVREQGLSLPNALSQVNQDVNDKDKSYCQELAYGILRFYHTYKTLISGWTDKLIKDETVLLIIVSGFYQLQYMRTAKHAAINETVELTKALQKQWATKLVNALLRRFERDAPEKATPIFPSWLAKAIKKAWPEQVGSILEYSHFKPPMELRLNLQQVNNAEYLETLANNHIEYSLTEPDSCISLKDPMNVHDIPGFTDGNVSVQAKGAQWAAILLKPENDMNILDACAAPGGKTIHILELAPAAKLTAVDIDEQRLARVSENLQRTNKSAELVVGDMTQLKLAAQSFDRILLDAPCSATGVIARHPDIKHLRRSSDIQQLNEIQIDVLNHCWNLLKPGGILLYSTCSILPAENDQIIAEFLNSHEDAELEKITENIGLETSYGRQLLPGPASADGFYYCRIRKG